MNRINLLICFAATAMFSPVFPLAASPPARMPLRFEVNQGQMAPEVRFTARGMGYNVLLTGTEAVFASGNGAVYMRLEGANLRPVVEGLEPLGGHSNYLLGSDPARWHSGVKTFARVQYSSVYPGIDVIYHGHQQSALEYDFVLAPGADPRSIRMRFDGIRKMRVGDAGELILETPGGETRQHKPVVYQQVKGVRKEVSGEYLIERNNQVRFKVGSYDARETLIIDPVISYASYLGGDQYDEAYGVATDTAGNIYITGSTKSANFPVTASAGQSKYAGNGDAFVAKLDSSGNAIYCTYLGGESDDSGYGIAVDAAGNAYVAGTTYSHNFPVNTGTLKRWPDNSAGFAVRLDSAGNLVYGRYISIEKDRGDNVWAKAIAVDASGNAYVTGKAGDGLTVTSGTLQSKQKGGFDAFVFKLDPTGTAVYSTYLGGSGVEEGLGIAVSAEGNAFVAGHTNSSDFPVTSAAYQRVFSGGSPGTGDGDGFVAKLDSDGTSLIYATYLGGDQDDRISGIALDSAGNAYLTGTAGSRFPITSNSVGRPWSVDYGSDAFAAKLDPSGSSLMYSVLVGGTGVDAGYAIAVDSAGVAHVTGYAGNIIPYLTSKILDSTLLQTYSTGTFISSVDPTGELLKVTLIGKNGWSRGRGITVDTMGNRYVVGETVSPTFPVTSDAKQPVWGGNNLGDAFIMVIRPD